MHPPREKLQPSKRLEVTLTDGRKHIVRHPDHWCVQARTGRILLFPEKGPFEVQIDPGDVAGLKAYFRISASS